MLWDDKDDSKDWQRFKNFVFLDLPVSNKTRDEVLPGLVVVLGVLMTVFGMALLLS